MKRMRIPASPADYRCAAGARNRPTIGLPEIGSMHRRARRAGAVGEPRVAPAAAPPPLEWTRRASSRAGMATPMGAPRASPGAAGKWVRWAARRVLARARSAGAVVLKRDSVLPTLK